MTGAGRDRQRAPLARERRAERAKRTQFRPRTEGVGRGRPTYEEPKRAKRSQFRPWAAACVRKNCAKRTQCGSFKFEVSSVQRRACPSDFKLQTAHFKLHTCKTKPICPRPSFPRGQAWEIGVQRRRNPLRWSPGRGQLTPGIEARRDNAVGCR